MFSNERMGEVLVRIGMISEEQLRGALDEQASSGGRLGDVLVRGGAVTEDQLAAGLAEQKGLEYVSLSSLTIDDVAANLLPAHFLQRKSILPVGFDDGRLVLAMSDPLDVEAIDETEMLTGYRVTPIVATARQIDHAIETTVIGMGVLHQLEADFGSATTADDVAAAFAAGEKDAPVVGIVNQVLRDAVREGASDVHFEPEETGIRVRFRIDGVLRDVTRLPKGSQSGLVSRLKIMADMDIAERRRPQDGRIAFRAATELVDLRVATVPTPAGEGVVIRVLHRGIAVGSIEGLGMSERDSTVLRRMLSKPYGAVLISGPTGSGKTTTLYTALTALNSPQRKIVTIEDPIEYTLTGVTQIAVNKRVGLTFAAGLRNVLRLDPDVVMVGEIRDAETASIAVRAALTGHYVLSSIHTNDAPAAVSRLTEMGVEPYITSSALLGVVAQRLVRVLCPQCKKPVSIPQETLIAAGFSAKVAKSLVTYGPVGCPSCHLTGYTGRMGVFEVLEMDEDIAALYLSNAPGEVLRETAQQMGMTTMRADALNRVALGTTSLDEVNRVVV
ncbi:MAG: Flp pilus assembly complex ATPase component TadA [Coriobacteriia bacterium]|nr:Flp pilus assembly complex ATPase component TadA [Coriobacteriia bacterium]